MRATLTVTHRDGIRQSYVLECSHGSTNGEAAAIPLESRERYVSSLLAHHGLPYGCTCAAETDLVDEYPSIESAIEQIAAGSGHGMTELDSELNADLVENIKNARCPECSIAVRVLPLHLPPVVAPIHAPGCPRSERAN